jgi:hypothetical protein
MPRCDYCGEIVGYSCEHIKQRVWDHALSCYLEYYYCDFGCFFAHVHSSKENQ